MSHFEFTRHNLMEYIQFELDRQNISIAELERRSNISKDSVRDFLRGKVHVLRIDKAQKILETLAPELKKNFASIGATVCRGMQAKK